MAKAELPSPDLLRKLLDYNPETGVLRWRERGPEVFSGNVSPVMWNKRNAGKVAFPTLEGGGYHHSSILGHRLKAHRVAWAIYYGEWPVGQIDHLNHIRTDNRISNLRVVTNQENHRNRARSKTNSSGVTGVSALKPPQRGWQAYIGVDGKDVALGRFEKFEDAVIARKAAEARYGFHQNHGQGSSKASKTRTCGKG